MVARKPEQYDCLKIRFKFLKITNTQTLNELYIIQARTRNISLILITTQVSLTREECNLSFQKKCYFPITIIGDQDLC